MKFHDGRALWMLPIFLLPILPYDGFAVADVDYERPQPAYALTNGELQYAVMRGIQYQLRPVHIDISGCDLPMQYWENSCHVDLVFPGNIIVHEFIQVEYDGCHWILRSDPSVDEVEQFKERNDICG